MTEALELPGIEFTAVCDAYRGRAERARAMTEESARIYDDYREILDSKDVDAVIIGSPDHWHRQMSLDALAAGKDVYIEKPMTYTIGEGNEIAAAVTKSSRIYQVGSQGRAPPPAQGEDRVLGRLGQVTLIRVTYNRNTAGASIIHSVDAS
jgi:predicted dehydrogenase